MSQPGARIKWFGAIAILAGMASLPAGANWVASGNFRYQDREWDQTGFTGTIVTSPARYVDIEVIDALQRAGSAKAVIAKGKTDANGAFSVSVVDGSVRTVRVRAVTTSTQTPDLFVKVTNMATGSVWAVASADIANHGPNTNVDFGTLVAGVGTGGESFNIFDLGVTGADYVKALTGARPGSTKLVTFRWASNGGIGGSSTSGNTVTLRDSAGYDDTPILHEWSHYVMNNYSKSSNPGGTHQLANCNEDLRLAFDEGRASFFGCSVRRSKAWPNANIYLRTDGGSGPGHSVLMYDLETEAQYQCVGDTSEVTVSRSLWDIGDGAGTSDLTIGTEDATDRLSLPDSKTWQVFTGPIKSATNVTHERFWDGWFDATVAGGFPQEMKDIFTTQTIEFFPDANEPNNTAATATGINPNNPLVHLTYFSDPDGDGKGAADPDLFSFSAQVGVAYTVETLNLLSDANTNLEIIDTNGTTVLASNNDRSASDPSSRIVWTAPRSGTFFVRSTHAADYGIYGSYDLRITK